MGVKFFFTTPDIFSNSLSTSLLTTLNVVRFFPSLVHRREDRAELFNEGAADQLRPPFHAKTQARQYSNGWDGPQIDIILVPGGLVTDRSDLQNFLDKRTVK